MATPPTLGSVARNVLSSKWRDAMVGAATLLLVACIGWVTSDIVASRDKLRSIPDPAQIVTNVQVEKRFVEQDKKIDDNAAQAHESLVRIESKLDTLVLSMATRHREQSNFTYQVPPPPYASAKAPEKPVEVK